MLIFFEDPQVINVQLCIQSACAYVRIGKVGLCKYVGSTSRNLIENPGFAFVQKVIRALP